MMVPPTFCIFDFSLAMFSSSSLLSVAGIIFRVNVWRCGKVVSLSKSSSLAHAHCCLAHARSCDKGLPKERIIDKSWRKTIPDTRLARRDHS